MKKMQLVLTVLVLFTLIERAEARRNQVHPTPPAVLVADESPIDVWPPIWWPGVC